MIARRGSIIALAALAGCTPGPHAPSAEIALPPARADIAITPQSGLSQQIDSTAQPLPHWWESFENARLTALVAAALAHNNDLAAAEATLRQARELAGVAAATQGPQIDATLQSQRLQVSQTLAPPLPDPNAFLYSLQTAQVSVTYPLDVFGGGRSRVRSARAAAEVARQRLIAAQTTIVANLTLAVIQHAALGAQLAATQDAVAGQRELVRLTERRRQLGDLGEADVVAQQAALASLEAGVPPLARQLEHQRGLISGLLGIPAGAEIPELPTLDALRLPARLPLALPAAIVTHRPDVRAVEAQMQGAAADLGTAIAARLPTLMLSGNIGGSATRLENVFASGNPFFTVLGSIAQPLFHSGQLLHQKRAAAAALDVAEAQYRAAALQAFLDVDDALAGLKTDADALDAATRAQVAAARALELTRRQLALGAVGRAALLGAAVSANQANVQLIQVQAARLGDSVALFQASGMQPVPR